MSKSLLGLPLAPAEAATLRYLTEGYTVAEIARRQSTRASTVHSRAARARRKLGAGSNDHAVQLYAQQQAAASRPVAEQAPLETTVSDPTALAHADSMIEKAWGRPIAELEKASVRLPVEDPLLRTAMHTRSHLVVVSNAAVVHQERLHALTRPDHVPAFYDLDRITQTASALRTAYAESNTALQAISHVIDARELSQGRRGPGRRARTGRHRPHLAGTPPLGAACEPARPAGSRRLGPAGGEPALAAGQFASRSWWAPGSTAPTARASSSTVSSTRRPSASRAPTASSCCRSARLTVRTAHWPSPITATSPIVQARPALRILRSSAAMSRPLLGTNAFVPLRPVRPRAVTLV
ncbi:hypothetical protein [Kitasatospora sp. NPDC057936]|uniref:hypothetical protein n=1 Tax=Kitasatospora sp. NPDC057936 TaxID=3346283 RepID=UPI0036D79534